jgi:RNA polymerase sigma-70 factor, ECF subfamily
LTRTDRRQRAGEAHGGGANVAGERLVLSAVSRAREGDTEALHFLYVRFSADILRFVKSLVKDHHEAEDITQNVFLKLPRALRRYEPREVPFTAWVMRVSRNAALDHLRANRTIACEEVRVTDHDHASLGHERRGDLRQALAQLPAEQRDVLILRHIAGLSPLEIAAALGKTESSVHGLHHRGRRSLKLALSELGAAPVVAG